MSTCRKYCCLRGRFVYYLFCSFLHLELHILNLIYAIYIISELLELVLYQAQLIIIICFHNVELQIRF